MAPASAGDHPPPVALRLGTHWGAELTGCPPDRIASVQAVEPVLREAVERSRATVLIAESHFCLHSWPEHDDLAVDVFTCGDMDAELAIRILAEGLQAKEVAITRFERGIPA